MFAADGKHSPLPETAPRSGQRPDLPGAMNRTPRGKRREPEHRLGSLGYWGSLYPSLAMMASATSLVPTAVGSVRSGFMS